MSVTIIRGDTIVLQSLCLRIYVQSDVIECFLNSFQRSCRNCYMISTVYLIIWERSSFQTGNVLDETVTRKCRKSNSFRERRKFNALSKRMGTLNQLWRHNPISKALCLTSENCIKKPNVTIFQFSNKLKKIVWNSALKQSFPLMTPSHWRNNNQRNRNVSCKTVHTFKSTFYVFLSK